MLPRVRGGVEGVWVALYCQMFCKLFWCGRKVERICPNFRAWLSCPQSVVAMPGARHDAQLYPVEPIPEVQVAPHRILVQLRE
jgi:hypothetical protein